jgi:hypothetical protein
MQREHADAEIRLQRRSRAGQVDDVVDTLMSEERGIGLDVSSTTMRVTLAEIAPGRTVMLWTYSHLLVDGWSAGLVADEVVAAYDAFRAGTELKLEPAGSYAEYVVWGRNEDLTDVEFFWAEQLSGVTEPTPMPTDGVVGRMPFGGDRFGARAVSLPRDVSGALRASVRERGVTLAAVVLACWGFLLSRYTGAAETTTGLVVAGRPFELDDIETTVGMFANALPVRATTTMDASPLDAAADILRLLGKILTHQHVPLAQLRGWSAILQEQPLFLSAVNVQTQLFHEETERRTADFTMTHLRTDEPPQSPLQITVTDAGTIELSVEYLRRWFDDERAGDVLADLATVLATVAEDPARTFREIDERGLDGRDRIDADGDRAFRGHALALFGFRTTLEEIEGLGERIGSGELAIVPYRSGERLRVAAYVRADVAGATEIVRRTLGGALPPFLVPDPVLELAELPRAGDGTLDRDQLPPIGERELRVAPRSETETVLAHIWAEALGVEEVGVFDNFFELGGESLAAMLISAKASEALGGMEVPMRLVLELQTVAAVADALEA